MFAISPVRNLPLLYLLLMMGLGMTVSAVDNHPPVVTNVVAKQVGQQVEIVYDLEDADGDLMTVRLQVSSDGGSNFDIEARTLTGDVGERIAGGKGKNIIWQVALDIPDLYGTNFVFEVVADDNVGPIEGFVSPTDGSKMVLIPAGSFEMGDHLDGMSNALPVHTVTLDAFYMDIHEVTVGQFRQFVNQSSYNYPDYLWNQVANYSPGDNYPMVKVSWNDATAYAEWAGKRLPTEAEWEYAARGGLEGNRYPWGNEITHDDANSHENVGGKDKWDFCSPVGSFEVNGYGLFDVAGNVREWCADWSDETYYSNSPAKNPLGPDTGTRRVLRGGSWVDYAYYLRVAGRSNSSAPTNRLHSSSNGFRCVSGLADSVRYTSLPVDAAQSPATSLELSVSRIELPASTQASTTITVRLYNKDDIPIKGDVVNLTVDKGTIQSPAVDNGDGTYTATYTAANTVGTAKIMALTNSGQFATATINLLEIHLSLSAPADQIDAGTTMDLTLTVKDSKGNAVMGETVELTADQGTVKLIDEGDGSYTAQYMALEVGGNAKITATTSSGKSQSINLQVVDISIDESSMKAMGKIVLQTGEEGEGKVEVTVIGPRGTPVPGRKVTLTADPAEKFKVKPRKYPWSSMVTNAHGVSIIAFVAGKPGPRILTASVNGVEFASIAFMFTGWELDQSKWVELSADKKWEKDGAFMNLIPAGSFEMGDHLDNMGNASPVHTVELDAFYMDVHEVTVGQFKQFMQQSGYESFGAPWDIVHRSSPTDDHPMICVSWNAAKAYADWAGKRLPTEAEWEYAARGGLTGKRYPWGDDITHDDANYSGTGGKDKWEDSAGGGTAPVGSFSANGYGLHDMAGNAHEWCADWYDANYYATSLLKNPKGPISGELRVLRGGSWRVNADFLRVANRGNSNSSRLITDGFRCVSGF